MTDESDLICSGYLFDRFSSRYVLLPGRLFVKVVLFGLNVSVRVELRG